MAMEDIDPKILALFPWLRQAQTAAPVAAPTAQLPQSSPVAPSAIPQQFSTPATSGTASLIQQDNENPVSVSMPGSNATDDWSGNTESSSTGSTGKSNALSKILPLVLRYVLPTAAGAAIGSRSPFLGALPGALGAAAVSGVGALKGNELQRQFNTKSQAEQAKAASEEAWKNKNYSLDRYKVALDAEDTSADNSRADAELGNKIRETDSLIDWRKRQPKGPSDNDVEKLYKYLDKQTGRQYLDPNNPEDYKVITEALRGYPDKNLPILAEKHSMWGLGKDVSLEPNPEDISAFINSYNRDRGIQPATSTKTQPPTAVGKARDEAGNIFWIDAQGNAISQVE